MKIVVFDLDETMGYFTEIAIFWDCLNKYLYFSQIDLDKDEKYILTTNDFDDTLDLYPEFLRPEIFNILKYLKKKKHTKCCSKMMIYTNNQGPEKWAYLLKNYFEKKINYELFDQVIRAFKINGKIFEVCRTQNDKSYKDLIKCTKLPLHAEICFLDDNVYPEMLNDNVFYINVQPYTYYLSFDEMMNRFLNSKLKINIIKDEVDFKEKMSEYFENYHFIYTEKNQDEYDIDIILSKQILNHLHTFFNTTLNPENEKHNKSNKNKSNKKTHKKK